MRKRNPRLDQQVTQVLAQLLETDFSDPRLNFVTITEVQVSQDAKEAVVFWSVPDQDVLSPRASADRGDSIPRPDQAQAALESAAGRLQGLLSDRVKMRNTPVLRFEQDPVREAADRVEQLLREARAKRGA